jgi:hypothetical protein
MRFARPSLDGPPARSPALVGCLLPRAHHRRVWQSRVCDRDALVDDGEDVLQRIPRQALHVDTRQRHGAGPRGAGVVRALPGAAAPAARARTRLLASRRFDDPEFVPFDASARLERRCSRQKARCCRRGGAPKAAVGWQRARLVGQLQLRSPRPGEAPRDGRSPGTRPFAVCGPARFYPIAGVVIWDERAAPGEGGRNAAGLPACSCAAATSRLSVRALYAGFSLRRRVC